MSITPRGSSYQVSITINEKRYRRSFKTHAEAEQWELEAQLKAKRGEDVKTKKEEKVEQLASQITWGQLRKLVYDQRWKNHKSATTHNINSKAIVKMIGENNLVSNLTQAEIDKLPEKMREEKPDISASTLNRKFSSLSVMIRYAKKRGYINKPLELPKYKEPEHRIRWISDEEEKEMMSYFNTHKPVMADIVTLLIYTGLRLSELWKLKVEDVSDTHLTVWVSKGGKPRSVPLVSQVRAVFEKHKVGKRREEQIFPNWTNWQLSHYWNRCRKHLDLEGDPQFVPHVCRHTFCTRLIKKGVPIVHVQRLAGHLHIETTMRYAHLSQEDLDRAILVLEGSESVSENVPKLANVE